MGIHLAGWPLLLTPGVLLSEDRVRNPLTDKRPPIFRPGRPLSFPGTGNSLSPVRLTIFDISFQLITDHVMYINYLIAPIKSVQRISICKIMLSFCYSYFFSIFIDCKFI